jgi:hypothetical protein
MTIFHDPNVAGALVSASKLMPPIVLYVGPDQIMPLTSVLGAIAGIALMFWNRIVGLFVKVRSMFSRNVEASGKSSAE